MAQAIAAPATPLLPSAVSIVRVSGENLTEMLNPLVILPSPRVASLRTLKWAGYKERALVLYFPGPNSYTGEDLVEFQLHGNPLLVRRFLEHLYDLGIRIAEPGEFTRRALMNGKQGLLDAEALRDQINSVTDAQLKQAQAFAGGVPAWIIEAKNLLGPWLARVEASVDYGEEEGIGFDMAGLRAQLEALKTRFHVEQKRSEAARWIQGGIRIALVGRPNAGKSTLFNALAGEDRAIVTEIPGTTRDVLEVRTEWNGLPLYLFDTAGLRASEDPIERLGIARVNAVLEKVDLILHLIPLTDAVVDDEILEHLRPYSGKVMEIGSFGDCAARRQHALTDIVISAAKADLEGLRLALNRRFLGEFAPEACLGALYTQRQRELLSDLVVQLDLLFELPFECPAEVIASSLQGLWHLLLRLTGEDRAESSLDQVFSGFCLGK